MFKMAVHERFRAARLRQARTLAAIALQIGAREDWLRAIEDGRFGDLPSGLYGRATLRGYAKALGLNGDEMLADCASLLPALDVPIAGLARLKGLRPRDDRLPKPPSDDSHPMAAPAHAAAHAWGRRSDVACGKGFSATFARYLFCALRRLLVVVDAFQSAHVRPQGVRNHDRAVALLVVLQDRDQRSADCQPGSVQRMDV